MASLTAAFATLAPIVTAVGGFVSTAAAYQQNKFQQSIAEQNAKKARQDAAAQEVLDRRGTKRQIAAAQARYGASGVELAGTPLQVLGDMASQAEEQALLIRYGGVSSANNSNLQARSFGSQATGSLISGGANTFRQVGGQLENNYRNFDGAAFPAFA